MFWIFIADQACRTAQEDVNYHGFNKETIILLDMIDVLEGIFAAKNYKKYSRYPKRIGF